MSITERYSRQMLLSEVGIDGQKALMESSVLVIGAGGLGSPNIMFLAGAGVGRIDIVDGDIIDISNLHRQIAHKNNDIGLSKAVSACRTAQTINPNVSVNVYNEWFDAKLAEKLIGNYDIVLDCVDNLAVKYLINDACVLKNQPFVHAGVVGWKGQIFTSKNSACLRCVVPEPTPRELAPTCSRVGILGPMAGIMGCLQAMEAIKYLTFNEKYCLINKMMKFDGKTNTSKIVNIEHSNDCSVCGSDPKITSIQDVEMPVCSVNG